MNKYDNYTQNELITIIQNLENELAIKNMVWCGIKKENQNIKH
jgi:hypothetical protein